MATQCYAPHLTADREIDIDSSGRFAPFADDADVVERVLAHVRDSTTDLGEPWFEPVDNYLDPQRFDAERRALRRLPMVFAPAASVVEPGDYLAREVVGVPLFANRDRDGLARVFRNACRHRGAAIVDGQGCAQALVCNYHGWSYRLDGSIAHIPHADGFPDGIADERALVELDSCEANGLIIIAGPEGDRSATSTGIDAPQLLLADTLADHRHITTTWEEQPINWKVLIEQTLEGYHIRSAHRTTFYPVQYDNLNVIEFSGMHSRVTYPYRNIERQATMSRAERKLRGSSTTVTHLFPNTIVATFPELTLVTVIDPLTIDRSRITNFLLTTADAHPDGTEPITSGTSLAAEGAVEDTEMSLAVQAGFRAGANDTIVFGANESAIGHFHRSLDEALAAGAQGSPTATPVQVTQ